MRARPRRPRPRLLRPRRPDGHRRRGAPIALLVAAIFLVLGVGIASAAGGSSVEGVWSFKGGEIAVQPSGGGAFKGTVVTETKFAECAHPVGQVIWSDMRSRSDGSLWGFHQWYFESGACAPNPTLGPTAWRVMENAAGTRYLRVCLSPPGSTQPTIATNGLASNAVYGCVNSAESTAGVASFNLVSLPSNKKCLSLRHFPIHIRDPKADAFKSIVITLGKRHLTVTRHGNYSVANVSLVGLPRGKFTIVIRASTFLGHRLFGKRTYHTCVPKKRTSSKHRRHEKAQHKS
jgi:hypothetical protein